MRARIVAIAAGSLVAFLAAGVPGMTGDGHSSGVSPVSKRPVNVLLITLDTTRADHIGAYGYTHGRTPVIDKLAAEGCRFAHAQSPAPLTLPAHASILTGTYPTSHGLRNNGSYFLPPGSETLAKILKDRGYRTAAFVASFILDSRFGLDQGFDVYDDRMDTAGGVKDMQSERPAGEVFDAFDAWLAAGGDAKPFFCWLHFYDPHRPYAPPEPFKSDRSLSPYDGEIANVDLNLGKVFDALRSRGEYDDTLIVVTADHGEGLGEHGEYGHGIFCYQETLAVPLLMRLPGRPPQPAVVDETVGLVDIMPTVLAAVGAPLPAGLEGISLLPLMAGKHGRERGFYFESLYAQEDMGGAPLTGLLSGGWKYFDLPRPELYDLKNDPQEKTNLVSGQAAEADRLKTGLKEWAVRAPLQKGGGTRVMSPEERRRLESLGYVAAAAPKPAGGVLRDPKDLIAGWTENLLGKSSLEAGDLKQAEQHFERAIELNPVFFSPYVDLSRLRFERGEVEGGLAVLKKGVERNPGSAAPKIEYARGLADADRPEEALDVLKQAETQMVYGERETVDAMIGVTLSRLERFKEASDYLRRALDIEPDNFAAARDLGYCLYRSGLPAEAVPFYKRAAAGQTDDPIAPAELALCQAALKDFAAAAFSFEMSLRRGPSQRTYFNYAVMTAESGDLAKAVNLMTKCLEQPAQDPELAQTARSLLENWKNRLNP